MINNQPPQEVEIDEQVMSLSQDDMRALGLVSIGEGPVRLEELGGKLDVDRHQLTITLDLPPERFIRQQHSLASTKDVVPSFSGYGFYSNYLTRLVYHGNGAAFQGLLDANVATPVGIFNAQFASDSSPDQQRLHRLWTNFRHDDPQNMHTLEIGDAFSSAGQWGTAARFIGVKLGKNFGLRPGYVYSPTLSFSSAASVPSTVSVFQGGRQILSQEINPGPFSITDISPYAMDGSARLVVKDVFGHEQVITQSLFSAPQALAPGMENWSAEAGKLNRLSDSWLSGTYKRGFDSFTAEAHAEMSGDQYRLGGTWIAAGQWGSVAASLAGGNDGQALAQGQWTISRGPWSANAMVTLPHNYYQIGSNKLLGKQAMLNLAYTNEKFSVHGALIRNADTTTTSVGLSYRINGQATISGSVFSGGDSGILGALIWNMERHSVSLQTGPWGDAVNASLSFNQDTRWNASAGQDVLSASVSHNTSKALLDASISRINGQTGYMASANGAVVLAGGETWLTKPVTGGVALVETGEPNVPILLFNRKVATTNDAGRAVVPELAPSRVNRLSADMEAMSPGFTVKADASVAVVPGGFSVAQLEIERPGFFFDITLNGQQLAPGVEVAIGERKFIAGSAGVYVQGLKPGRHPASISGVRCPLEIEVPQRDEDADTIALEVRCEK
ncbi:MAG: fimbria/pilus outer membrane usher protein [Sulfurimicrobium sp.]|nr:fimbria/pilus outer membrane usher protein [Sulfurimicrobium sp.]